MPRIRIALFLLAWSSIDAATAIGQARGRRGGGDPPARRPFAKPGTPKQAERVRTFDVRHVRADLRVDLDAETIRGTATHSLASLVPRLDRLTLDCGEALEVTKVTAGGAGCKFERKGDELIVALDRPYKPDEAIELVIAYGGKPATGIHFIKDDPADPGRPPCAWTQGEAEETRHWLPCYDYPNDKATSEMVITAARLLTVVSNGRLVEKVDGPDGSTTHHWKMDVPHASYLISLAIAEFAVARDTAAGTLPVEYYALKGTDEATMRRALGKTPKMIEFFNATIGTPYAYPKYAQVCAPEFGGGMENISATTMTDDILRDPIASLGRDSDSLVAHELAHQWFGDLLTCRDWSSIWLNEGFASYFDPLFAEHDLGVDAFRLNMADELRSYVRADRRVRRPIVEARYNDPNDLFEEVTYQKGACVLHALRGLLGDDAWGRGIKGYVAANKAKSVVTDDFRKAMEEASGRDLGWFFEQWVFKAGHPELKARWQYEDADKTVRLRVEQVQAIDDQTPLFRVPTTVQVGDAAGVRSTPIVIDGRSAEFVIPCPARPRIVRIDPEGWVPKQLTFDKPTAEWAYQLEHAADALGRVEAARVLADRVDEPDAVAALAASPAREKQPIVRVAMVEILADAGDPLRPALIAAAKDADPRVRIAALEGLAGLKPDAAAEATFRDVWGKAGETYDARRRALRGLAKLKVKDLDDLLAAALKETKDRRSVAAEAVRLSMDRGGPAARESAFLYARPGQPLGFRRAALDRLGRLASDDKQAEAALIAALDEPDRAIRGAATRAISEHGVTAALPELERRLAKAKDLSRMSLEGAVNALRGRLKESFAPADGPEPAELERKAADLELQARELRNQAEALKLKAERAKAAAARPAAP